MKIYHSLDFDANKQRVEKTSAGEYIVHAEDFESINDLVERSVRTRTKLNLDEFASDKAEYDTEDEFFNDLREETGQQDTSTGSSEEAVEAEQSEAATPLPDEPQTSSVDAI